MAETTTKIANARYAITVDERRRIIRDASIVIRGDRIVAVGRAADLADVPADRVIDATRMVVTPGFINTHDHLYPQLMRGLFPDTMIGAPYIRDSCALRQSMSDEEQYVSTLSALAEHLVNGTTCVVNPGDAERVDPAIQAYEDSGARVIVGRCVTDRPDISHTPVMSTEDALADLESTVRTYDGRCDGRVRGWVMLSYGVGPCSPELLTGAKRLADELGTGLTFHQSARQAQVDDSIKAYGMRPIEYLAEVGALGDNVLLGHAVALDEREIDLMARTGTRAAQCPVPSLRLGFGTTRIGKLPELLDAGVVVGLGTDSPDFASTDLLRTVFLAATLYKDARQDTNLVPAEAALELATIRGAEAVGLAQDIGSITVGKKADLVLFDTDRPEWSPLLNPINTLVYNADGRSVHTVLVDGRTVVEAGKPTFTDQTSLVSRLQQASESLIERTGVEVAAPRWPVES
ncbi:amidohydrolase family protein [Streptomyces sp. NBC_00005]|uniref:amidohydrolase family protein n=1 Tax=Streptomyces sp. NBC_00005 TaxID=2903609 RepID=UPI003246E2AA